VPVADGSACGGGAGRCRAGVCQTQGRLAAGNSLSCVAGDPVTCWGRDYELEGGAMAGLMPPPAAPFTKVSVYESTACAIDDIGEVMCWGTGLGPDIEVASEWPDMKQVVVGATKACALGVDGLRYCWSLASGTTEAPSGEQFTALAAGATDVCGIAAADGALRCNVLTPPAGTGYRQLDGNYGYFCAVPSEGGMRCWSDPEWGMVTTSHGSDYVQIAVGAGFVCGRRSNGTVRCPSFPGPDPTHRFSLVAAGYQHACGVRIDGVVECWGYDSYGETDVPGTCGDGIVDLDEACDGSPDCEFDCGSRRICGNGLKNTGEVCDDGNDVIGHWCSADCQTSTRCQGTLDLSTGLVCDAATPSECMSASCDPQAGCVSVPVADGTGCSGGTCTMGTCQ
jgi:cysteine-rich repeat protein